MADSSATARAMLTRAFERNDAKIECVACKSGAEALDRLRQERFDLLTTELQLPDIGGLELCERLRAQTDTCLIPVIVISAEADERLQAQGFAAGVTDYFNKDRGPGELAAFVSNYLRLTLCAAPNVLLVEDSKITATVLKKMLRGQGMRVTHFADAESAVGLLDEIESQGGDRARQFDIVLSDLQLEGELTGGDLLRHIRAGLGKSAKELPVLILTANNDPAQQTDLLAAGANDFIVKPGVKQVIVARARSLVLLRQQHLALK